jgi:C1A family cysteine protease
LTYTARFANIITQTINTITSTERVKKIMRRLICLLCALLMGGLVMTSSAGAMDEADLVEIRRAIREQGARWEAGDNPVFRLSHEEQRRLCGAALDWRTKDQDHREVRGTAKPKFPQRLDWRDVDGLNYITPITNQAGCGSCVAFGTIATLEAMINITGDSPGSNLDLSEQHIFSCGGGNCDYGWSSSTAAEYLQYFGAPMESCLPYVETDDNCEETCSDWEQQARKISAWGSISGLSTVQTIEQFKTRLMDGPVVGGMVVFDDFFSYSSGVYQHVTGELAGGHCISIVGWDDADSCWICKNSWGPGWGEDGFFRIRMGFNESDIEDGIIWMTPEPPQAYVQIVDYGVVDEVSGNGDGIPDANETFDLTVTLSNPQTWGFLTDVQGWMLSTDPRVSLLDVTASYPDLPDGATCTNDDDPFAVMLGEEIGIASIPFELYITGTYEGSYAYSTNLTVQVPVTVSQAGWPVETTAGVRCSPLMAWAGGGPRRLVAVEDNGTLHMWDVTGQDVTGFPFPAPGGQVWGSPAMGDLDGDGTEEIIFGSKNDTLYALHRDGTVMFKTDLGADIIATPVIADLEGDGSPEIVLGTMDSQLHVLTAQGQKYDPFPIILGGPMMAGAAVADLDGDNSLDVVIGAYDGLVYAISVQTGESLPGFPVTTGAGIWSAPSIGDLNADGSLEIVIGSDDRSLYAITSTGDILFSYATGQAIRSSPAIADLDANNRLDVIFTSQDGRVYAVNHQGYLMSGWPYDTGRLLWTSPIVLDVDDDGVLEVVVEIPGPQLIHLESNGTLLTSLSMETSGTVMSTPAAGDLDCDGDLELAVGGPGGVYVWNYPTASDVDIPWPMYRGNAQRTGYVGDVITGHPESLPAPSVPVDYALWQNYPNPFNPETTIGYALAQEGPVRLSIFNVTGQEVITLVDGHQTAGFHNTTWAGVDARGNHVSSGLYFCRLQAGEFAETKKMVLLR